MSPVAISLIFKIVIMFSFGNLVHCRAPNIHLNVSKDISSNNLSSVFTSTDRYTPIKKWQVGRVSRKHYEIVNMLWRKTKIFVNVEPTVTHTFRNDPKNNPTTVTEKNQNVMPLTHTTVKPVISSSTESYIEFYYLDDNDERIKRRESIIPTFGKSLIKQQNAKRFLQSPILSFRLNDNFGKTTPKTTLQTYTNKIRKETKNNNLPRKNLANEKPSLYGFLSSRFKIGIGPMAKPDLKLDIHNNNATTHSYFGTETCPYTTLEPENEVIGLAKSSSHNKISTDLNNIETTAYDKIKFFEMYDQQTMKPNRFNNGDSENMLRDNEIDISQKINLEDVDENVSYHDGNKSKNVKKHIDQKVYHPTETISGDRTDKKMKFKTVVFNANKATEIQNESRKIYRNSSRAVLWSEYPFAAVYVYEPSQVRIKYFSRQLCKIRVLPFVNFLC